MKCFNIPQKSSKIWGHDKVAVKELYHIGGDSEFVSQSGTILYSQVSGCSGTHS